MESSRGDHDGNEFYQRMGRKIYHSNSRGKSNLKFIETKLKGAYVIEIEKNEDGRGFFARIFERKRFSELGLDTELFQCNISFNKQKGTLRGMHYQDLPYGEVKIVRCTRGKIFDVIIDLRPDSLTYRNWFGIELSYENYKIMYIPKGFAHGFQTLEEDTEIFYHMSDCYMPEYARGIRWDDKAIGIKWPIKPTTISKNDQSYRLL